MQIRHLDDQLSVAPQIDPSELGALAAQGFRSVINNRPDGEAPDQPSSAAMEAAAERAGLAYASIPVVSGQLQDDQVQAFAAALAEMPTPVLAFCRTGTRSTMLWALGAARTASPDAVLARASEAGYDLSALRQRLVAASGA